MTVSEMIDWLKTQDQGATVEVIQVENGRDWHGDIASQVPFTPELSYYSDLRDNPHITPDKSYYNSRTLLLGEMP